MSNELEMVKAVLRKRLPDVEVQALMTEFTIASGNGSVSISGDATESVIVTGDKNIIGDHNQVTINQGTDPDELVEILHRVYQHSEKTVFARRTISHTLAMVFVDLMRLLYVVASEKARAANAARFDEFIDIAEQHFTDLRSQIARSSHELNAQLYELSLNLDKRISFILGRLKRIPTSSNNNDDFFKKMKEIGQQLDSFCANAIGEEYENLVHLVDTSLSHAVKESGIAPETASLDDIFRLRLYVQSQLLDKFSSINGSQLRTIADDMDQDIGIFYFALDKNLLDRLHTSRNDQF